jgi:hypothetical protein
MKAISTMTDFQKCKHVFRAVCEGVDCELTYAELEALQDCGFISGLKREKRNRWSFEWTDKLERFAKATPVEQRRIIEAELREDKHWT